MFFASNNDDNMNSSKQHIEELRIITQRPIPIGKTEMDVLSEEEKLNAIEKYVKNLIVETRLEYGTDRFAPRNESMTKYLNFEKSLKSDSMGCMTYECFLAKINDRDTTQLGEQLGEQFKTHNLILKTSAPKHKSKIVNDYLIGLHLNTISNMTNVFNRYHGMFRCNSNRLGSWSNRNQRRLRPNDMRYIVVSEGVTCSHSTTQLYPDMNLSEYLIKNVNITSDELRSILLQIFSGIYLAQKQLNFMHNNLIATNIIVHIDTPDLEDATIINYITDKADLEITTNIVPIIHNFHSSVIYKGILPSLKSALNENIISTHTPSSNFEAAYWNNDKAQLVNLLNDYPLIKIKHGSLDLYVDMIYGHKVCSHNINVHNLAEVARDFGISINERPVRPSQYDPLYDVRTLIYDLSKYVYVLKDDKSKELLTKLKRNQNNYGAVIDVINDIITFS